MQTVLNKDFLSNQNWYNFAQKWLKNTYLTPYNSDNYSDGDCKANKIHRMIHGAMHASRVALHTTMLHQLCKKQFPNHSASKFDKMKDFLKLNDEQILCLIRYVALGHDAARQGDGPDLWETQSALLIKNFLIEHQVPDNIAELFSKLAEYKDQSSKLALFMSKYEYSKEIQDELQYARLLIQLADCFDIIRVTANFQFSFITKMLNNVFLNTTKKNFDVFFSYAKHLLDILILQQDLCYSNIELFWPENGSYSKKIQLKNKNIIKWSFEHANNVIIEIEKTFKNNAFFSELLPLREQENIHLATLQTSKIDLTEPNSQNINNFSLIYTALKLILGIAGIVLGSLLCIISVPISSIALMIVGASLVGLSSWYTADEIDKSCVISFFNTQRTEVLISEGSNLVLN